MATLPADEIAIPVNAGVMIVGPTTEEIAELGPTKLRPAPTQDWIALPPARP
jgi:hypothetical protein